MYAHFSTIETEYLDWQVMIGSLALFLSLYIYMYIDYKLNYICYREK